ncbi:MAG: D-alanyl-D-alanine carboxypeptidase/D-alanyl-D-alanine-endopeptidase [Ectothiorhodospiraceae bacterium]|nr:D-alanyl-D-alanine carboxypeptidase/D-alanyl-D-alanine-endopeptidase [Ectothiorhodospiraceae bacterium]
MSLFALIIVLVWSYAAPAAANLPQPIAQVLSWQRVPASDVSLLVRDIHSGETLLDVNANTLRNPASVTKLYTSFAALETLGPAYRWRTEIYARQAPRGGRLDGDLWLRGYGDPYLVNEDFWRLVSALRRTGIETISGDLVFDNSHYALEPEDPGAFDNRPDRAYNQPPHPLLVNFNALQFHIDVDPERDAVRAQVDPPLPVVEVDNRLRPGSGRCGGFQRGVSYHLAEQPHVVLEGSYPRSCDQFTLTRVAVPPEVYAHGLFKLYWRQWGGSFDGGWREDFWRHEDAEPLLVHRSRPLAELIGVANKHSNNVMTRHFKLALGYAAYGEPATEGKGHRALMDALARAGVDTEGLLIDNAAGLSRSNRTTAVQVAQLLEAAHRSVYAPEFLASLPLSGLDGTMRSRFVDQPEAGRMRLKTGRLNDVSSVAGYVRTASDRELLVVVMVNAPEAHLGPGNAIQDAVLRWAFQQ